MAFELYEVGEQMMRHKIRQRHSTLSEEEVERKVIDWLQDRPDARLGDAAGRTIKRFRMEP